MAIYRRKAVREILGGLGYSTELVHSGSISITSFINGYVYYSYNGTEYRATVGSIVPEPVNQLPSLEVTVRDQSSELVPSATVSLYKGNVFQSSGLTSSLGVTTFSSLTSGNNYAVLATKTNYDEYYLSDISITGTTQLESTIYDISTGNTLKVISKDDGGDTLSTVTVDLYEDSGRFRLPIGSGTTNIIGNLYFRELTEGSSYSITPSKSGYEGSSSDSVVLSSGITELETVLTEIPLGLLEVTVRDNYSNLVENAQVNYYKIYKTATLVGTGATNASGVSSYYMDTRYASQSTAEKSGYGTSSAQNSQTTTSATTYIETTINLIEYGNIYFNLTDGSNPVSGATIYISDATSVVYSGVTDSSGNYDTGSIVRDDYSYNIYVDGYQNYSATTTLSSSALTLNIVLSSETLGTNLVINGGFEDADLTNWAFLGQATLSRSDTIYYEGSYGGSMSYDMVSKFGGYRAQNISVDSGKTYKITAAIYGGIGATSSTAKVVTINTFGTTMATLNSIKVNQWIVNSSYFNVGEGTDVTVFIYCGQLADSYYDMIRIQEVL